MPPPPGGTPPPYPAAAAAAPPPPGAGGAPAGRSNGLAVAALVFGILTFFCLGPLGGILAIVLGFLGLSRAREVQTGRGMSIAGIVLGAVGTVLTVVLFLLIVVGVGKAAHDTAQNIGGVAPASSYDLKADGSSCTADELGFVTYKGTIKNTTGSVKNFSVNTEIRDRSTNQVIESPNDIVTDIAPGDTAQWSVTTTVDSGVQPSCSVKSVENWFNN